MMLRKPMQVICRTGLLEGDDLPSEDKVAICLEWLDNFTVKARKFWEYSSYGLKHIVERWAGYYVSNGAFIEAARHKGYVFKPTRYGSPNAFFKMRINDRVVILKHESPEAIKPYHVEPASRYFLNPPLNHSYKLFDIADSMEKALEKIRLNFKKITSGVYVLECGGFYKIGRSVDIRQRIKQLSTGLPHEIELVQVIKTIDMIWLERHLHSMFADKRANGEWFQLDEKDVKWLADIDRWDPKTTSSQG